LRFGEFETSFAMMRGGLINEKIDGHDKRRHKPVAPHGEWPTRL
jgi:hypothetical protein